MLDRTGDLMYNLGHQQTINPGLRSKRNQGFSQSEVNAMTTSDCTSIPDGFKQCRDCGEIKPLGDFPFYRKKVGRYYYPQCKRCQTIHNGRKPRERFIVPEGHKRCAKCKQVKPHSEYHKAAGYKDGLKFRCKSCIAEDNAAWYMKPEVKEQHRISGTAWRKSPEGRVKKRASSAARLAKPEGYAKSKMAERAWRATPEGRAKRVAYMNNYRARKRALPATFTDTDWYRCLTYWEHRCAYCRRPIGLWHTLAQDHYIPVSKNGGYTTANIIPACHGIGGCNNEKADRDAHDFLVSKFGKRKARQIEARIATYFEWIKPHDHE